MVPWSYPFLPFKSLDLRKMQENTKVPTFDPGIPGSPLRPGSPVAPLGPTIPGPPRSPLAPYHKTEHMIRIRLISS